MGEVPRGIFSSEEIHRWPRTRSSMCHPHGFSLLLAAKLSPEDVEMSTRLPSGGLWSSSSLPHSRGLPSGLSSLGSTAFARERREEPEGSQWERFSARGTVGSAKLTCGRLRACLFGGETCPPSLVLRRLSLSSTPMPAYILKLPVGPMTRLERWDKEFWRVAPALPSGNQGPPLALFRLVSMKGVVAQRGDARCNLP